MHLARETVLYVTELAPDAAPELLESGDIVLEPHHLSQWGLGSEWTHATLEPATECVFSCVVADQQPGSKGSPGHNYCLTLPVGSVDASRPLELCECEQVTAIDTASGYEEQRCDKDGWFLAAFEQTAIFRVSLQHLLVLRSCAGVLGLKSLLTGHQYRKN